MTHYAWTIKVPGGQDIQDVTTLSELLDVLQMLSLPGIAPPHWQNMDVNSDLANHGEFVHNEGSIDEWSLIWTKMDEAPGDD